MAFDNNPNDPSNTPLINTGGGTGPIISPFKPVVKTFTPADLNTVLDQIKAAMPIIRFIYIAWQTDMEVEQKLTSTIYVDAGKVIDPILAKDPTALTLDDVAKFMGGIIAVARQAGKDFVAELSPIIGLNASAAAILSVFGLGGV